MSAFNPREFRGAIATAPRPEAGFWAAGVKLYRNDLVFRGCFDLTMVGCLVLAFTYGVPGISSLTGRHSGDTGNTVAQNLAPASKPRTLQKDIESGSEIEQTLSKVVIDTASIQLSGSEATDKLLAAARAANAGKLDAAREIVAGLDDRDPVTAYVIAAITVQEQGLGKLQKAQSLLRTATRQGIYPAYLLAGQLMYQMLLKDEQGWLPATERVIVDDTGTAHPVNRDELATAADLWWQRAGSFNRPEGLRMAGFSKMRGLSGKPDYVGASALWKIAAESGDSLSQYELALLLMYGTGVQPDVKEAIRLFRLARREIPKANLQLSAALLPSSMAGEIAAAEEGVQAAEESIRLLEKTPGEGTAHWLLGTYLTIAAPVRFKDMSRGIDEFERAIGTGMTAGAYSIAEAYRTGNGKPQDLACALAFYKEAEKSSKADVKDKIDELVPQLGEEGKARAERIRSRIAHPQNAWADFPELVSHFGPPEDTTWHSACDLSKQEG